MRQKGEYILQQMGDLSLLVPVGQTLADHNRPLKINESGAFLWELLEGEITEAELLERLRNEYEGVPVETLRGDLEAFIGTLRDQNMLEEN